MSDAQTIHAGCVLVGEAGLLIRGAAGAGKAALARELIAAAALQGGFARLVSDDRTRLTACHGRLVAEAVRATAGRIEARGVGILSVAHEPRAVVRLVVELSADEPSRMPAPEEGLATLCGVMVSCIRARSATPLCHLVLFRLREVQGLSVSRCVTAR